MIPLLLLALSPCSITRTAWPADALVIDTAAAHLRAVCKSGLSIEIARANLPGSEAYSIKAAHPKYVIAAASPRGALYGAYALADRLERGERPQSGLFTPRFAIREWWSAAFQANFNLPLGGAFDRPIEEISAIVERTIHEAPRYGINALQLMGRAGEGGIDLSWFLFYDDFPKLQTRHLGWGIERRTAEIRRLAQEAHRYGLDFLLWDHELVFPDRMLEAYPEIRGVDYPICFSHPLVMRFLNAKIDEFFRRLPEVDGINLTFAETRGYNILEHGATAFTSGPPILTFDPPNEFNVYAASRLAWDPSLRIDDLWRPWTVRRYGAKTAPIVERALRRTPAISQGIFSPKASACSLTST